MTFATRVFAAATNIVLGFYGFWLLWRLLLPVLPGPADRDERIAPYARYFTDPFVAPMARVTHCPARVITAVCLIVVAILVAGTNQVVSSL